jgi:uncharacterized membrane protein
MSQLIIGLALFLGIHSLSIFADGWRNRTIARLGGATWRIGYSLLSLLGIVLIVRGYAEARMDPLVLYVPPLILRHIAMILMAFVFPILLAAYLPGRIKATLKHPMLVAVKTWALAHLLANGMLADVLLFGSILVWAAADRISLRWRTPRPVSGAPLSRWNDLIAVLVGLAVYAAFWLGVHGWLTGIPLSYP